MDRGLETNVMSSAAGAGGAYGVVRGGPSGEQQRQPHAVVRATKGRYSLGNFTLLLTMSTRDFSRANLV